MNAPAERPIDRWFASYSGDHQHPLNQALHVVCVPAIVWSIVALLWCMPTPGTWFRQGIWAALAMFAAWMFYHRASRPLGYGMLAMFVLMASLTRWLFDTLGMSNLMNLAIGVFIVSWIGQFVGHALEGRRPSFLNDLTYLLIGPAWVVAKLYRRMGWTY